MNENDVLQNQKRNTPPLTDNTYVQELFAVLQDNGKDTQGLAALIGYVGDMESFVKRAEDRIADMKTQLAEMKEVQNHPVKTALQNTVKALEAKVAEVKERIAALKTDIIEGCKAAVTAFKENGIAALNNLARFFHVKDGLLAIDRGAAQSVRHCDKAIAEINSFAANYHAAGRAIRNMGRIVIGRAPVDAAKENGKLAKALAAPYKAEKLMLAVIQKSIGKTVAALDGMAERQAVANLMRRVERGDKPDLLAQIAANKQRVAREKLALPARDCGRTAGMEV